MTCRGTRHSTTRLWTGIITLLLISSQGATALNDAASSVPSEAITESPSGSVAPLRKLETIAEVPSTTLKYVGDVPEASVEGTIADKLSDSTTAKPNGSRNDQSLSNSKTENLEIQEPLKKVASVEDKHAANGSQPEFSENEDNGEIDDLDGDNDREPTTQSPKNEFGKENSVPKDTKHKAKNPSDEKPEKNVPEIGISLVNDTNVNYNNKKVVKGSKDDGAFSNDSNGPKSTLENATNVIASGSDATDGQEKGKGPKAQVEVVKNSTLPKVLRIIEAEAQERKEVESLGNDKLESVIETSESTVIPEQKDLANAEGKTSNLTVTLSGYDVDGERANDTKIPQIPRGRTISFGGTNEFITNDNKSAGPSRENEGITDQPVNQIVAEEVITKEPVRDYKSTDFKPYPYAKTNYRTNSTEVSSSGDSQVPESTEEASALENTIGQRRENKKFVVTEPSVVIDNSIQQFKPTYYKRSGNTTRISTSSFTTMPTTVSSLEGEGNSETTPSTKPFALDNDTTVFVPSLPISNAENDVPRSKDEVAKSSLGPKDTSGTLDLTGNGITEVIAGVKNNSVPVIEDTGTTKASVPLATSSISMSRATDNTLVQNTTEKIATVSEDVALTNIDVQTDPEESMLKISSFNVTESTEIDYNQSGTEVATSNQTLLTSTLSPESSSKSNSTMEITTTSTLIPSEGLSATTLMPEGSLPSTVLPENSSVPTLMIETSTKSTTNSTVSLMSNVSSMAPSVTNSTPTIPSILPNATSADLSITELEVRTTLAPEVSTNGFGSNSFKTTESLRPEESTESTTSKIEYVFVGLTESTASQQYIATSESSNSVTLDREFASSTPSSLAGSSTPGVAVTTLGASGNDNETTEMPEQISTDSITIIAANDTSEDLTTTLSTVEFTTLKDSTISMEEVTVGTTTTIEDEATTLTNEFEETTTEEVTAETNSTDVTGIVTDVGKNTTDTGRAVDSSTNIPAGIVTTVRNVSSTIIGTTEATDLSITTEIFTFPEETKIPSTNLTSVDGIENSTSKSTIWNSTLRISPTKIATTSPKPDTTDIPEDNVNVVTDDSIEITTRGGVPSLVKVVFEGSWNDVCPHLEVLRQSLADLLTSGLEKTVLASQIIFQKNPCSSDFAASTMTTESSVTTLLLYVVDENGNFDGEMTKTLPSLYSKSPIKLQVNIRSFQLVQDSDSGNAIAVVVVSCVALICLVLLAGLLFIMRKRQTRFNYGERCRPVSLDAYSLDSVSAYNSVRRKGAARASKRSYGNPTFEDSSAIPSHPLNFAGLSTFCNEQNTISEEFAGIPQVTARIDELPQGAEVKNRYANVVPLPETRVSLMKINNDPLTEYINASYVRGPKNATKYYIACQAPIESTVTDFWRMIWEQQSKVVIMLTDLVENGVEKCAEYIPPSEVTDCHRLFGDFQVTLKKRETKEKYAISTLHLKNLENNTFREISHIWYLWPANGVQSDAAGLIAVLLEARALQRGGPGPIVVHCSPGTGRTGTLIALDLGIRQYEITRTVDVPRVVYTIRRDRAGAVQTKEQYAFIYKALNLYATKLAGGALES